VVRNGCHQAREVVTSAGAVEVVVAPRVNDRRGSTSMIFGVFRHHGGRIARPDPMLRARTPPEAGIGDEIEQIIEGPSRQ